MKINETIIDISVYQNPNSSVYGTHNVISKCTESLNYVNPYYSSQRSTAGHFVGAYHFARFGGNLPLARAEANYFLDRANLAKSEYAILDYEDNYSDSYSNTQAILAFMDVCKARGYKPILYTGANALITHMYPLEIIKRYPKSLWVASYATSALNPFIGQGDWNNLAYNLSSYYSQLLPHIRWFQFTSTAISDGLDKSIVLIADTDGAKPAAQKKATYKGGYMFIYTLTEVSKVGGYTFGKGAKFLVDPIHGETKYIHADTWNAHKESLSTLPQEKGGAIDFTSFVALVGAGKVVYKK